MKKADFIIIGAVVVVAAVMLIFLYGSSSNLGSYVQIEIDGKITETLPLDEDTKKKITTENGGTNTLVIKDGKAKIVEANCPDGICKNHKAINRNGESIICLPHKVVVSVVDNNSDDEIDAVA